jgi:RimJ/RimL family protein N-acetyltransferase
MPEDDEDAIRLSRCLLRRWRMDDLESQVKHANDERVSRYMGPLPYPYTRADGERFLEAQVNAEEPTCTWAIVVDGEAVGGIGVVPGTRIRRRTGELGYWLGHAHWNKGIASEAIAAVVPVASMRLSLLRVAATVFSPNLASMRVLEKSDFTREGVLKRAIVKGDEVWDELIYATFPPAERIG